MYPTGAQALRALVTSGTMAASAKLLASPMQPLFLSCNVYEGVNALCAKPYPKLLC